MKRPVPLLISLLITTLLSAQSYFPTSDQNPVWTMFYNSFGVAGEVEIITGFDTLARDQIWAPVIEFDPIDSSQYLMGYYRVDEDKVFARHLLDCEGGTSLSCLTANDFLIYTSPNSNTCQYDITRIYVNLNSNNSGGVNDGTSWENAFFDLQDALAIADYGDTIWVAQGTYYPTDDNDREKYFELKNGVSIYGGFNGTETHLSQRNHQEYETVLSGDIGISGDSTDNSYHVLYTIGTDTSSTLNGFTITGGQADGNTTSKNIGGGMLLDANTDTPITTPTIKNCKFSFNSAGDGGGLYCNGGANYFVNPIIESCIFYRNSATVAGGGIYKEGQSSSNEAFTIYNTEFLNNKAIQGGGGIYYLSPCQQNILLDCVFIENEAIFQSGGVFFDSFCSYGELLIQNCFFERNKGTEGAGFGFAYTGFSSSHSDTHKFTITQSDFIENVSNNIYGGGISFLMLGSIGYISITQCNFIDNTSTQYGAGFFLSNDPGSQSIVEISKSNFNGNIGYSSPASGAILISGFSGQEKKNKTIITNSIFANNRGAFGSTSGLNGANESLIQNCTFYNNGEFVIAKNWSPDFNDSTFYNRIEIANSIFQESSSLLNHLFYNGQTNNSHLYEYNFHHSLIPFSNCNIEGGDTACGEGMIFNQNPLFLDTTLLDLRLAACSPVINVGNNPDSLISTTDLDGGPRVLEDIIDLGAYERNSFDVQVAVILNVSCYENQDAQVSFSIEGDEPYEYSWIRDSIPGEGNDQLAAGDYLFTITDSNDCSDTLSLTITEPEPIIGQYTVNHASTPSTSDGSIILDELAGGTPPYQFSWNNGDTTASLINIPPGEYALTVLDSNGCEQEYEFEINFISSLYQINPDLGISLYPNPTQDEITLSLQRPLSSMTQWFLYNNLGQVVLRQELLPTKKEYQIAVDQILPGIYFWEVHFEGVNINKGKLIILEP